ncbi:MAG TPA: hypothetical protein VKL40_06420 [Candidatus Angelobacter sp.]|nr:hypothetical protein [Candidatus Angelobacter sp.]
MRKKVKLISSNGQVDANAPIIKFSAGDEIEWSSFQNESADIVFASKYGSPFTSARFQVPAGGSVSSGPAIKKPQNGKQDEYKYTVIGQGGLNDPVIIVDN